jgi:hypothetical protein
LRVAERHHGVFTRAEAAAVGVGGAALSRAVAAGRFERVGRGVYRVAGSVRTWRQSLYADVLLAGPGAAASHRSAAALLGVPGFREGPLDVVCPRGGSRSGHRGVRRESNHLPAAHVRVVDGIPVTSLDRTLFDLCAVLTGRKATLSTRAVRNSLHSGATTLGRLWVVQTELGGRRREGSAAFRSILAAADDGKAITESELEELVLTVVRQWGLPDPERQLSVGDTTAPIGRVDFVYKAARLVVEADSRRHHSSWEEIEADRRRDARLMAAGWSVLRVTWTELTMEPDLVVAAIRTQLKSAA